MRHGHSNRSARFALIALLPLLSGCAGASVGDYFSSDLLSKDADWFSRSGRSLIKNVAIDAPPLTPDKPVRPDELISAEGACPGMAPPEGANALADGTSPAPAMGGSVSLGHTECDVTRGIGAPDSVNLSNNQRGDRVAVVTWLRGPRAGIYTFTAGRLSMVERAPEPPAPPKPARPAKRQARG